MIFVAQAIQLDHDMISAAAAVFNEVGEGQQVYVLFDHDKVELVGKEAVSVFQAGSQFAQGFMQQCMTHPLVELSQAQLEIVKQLFA